MKIKRAVVAGAAFLATFLGATQGVASAVEWHNSGDTDGSTGRCAYSYVCLYFNSGQSGAKFARSFNASSAATTLKIPDLAGYRFDSSGTGAGQAVKNNAASAEINSIYCTTWIYYNSNYGGNHDFLDGASYGQLWYTYNENASMAAGCP